MLPLVLWVIREERASVILIAPKEAWVPRLDGTAEGTALADPRQEAYAIPGGRLGVALEPGTMEPSCVIASGVSEEMGALQSRMLARSWEREHPLQDVCMLQNGECLWKSQAHIDPSTCTVSYVLSLPLHRLDSGSFPLTLKSMSRPFPRSFPAERAVVR